MGRGKKTCPECSTELGARTLKCSCGYEFKPKEPVRVTTFRTSETVEDAESDRTIPVTEGKILVEAGVTIRKTSPKEHAKRILGYGKERASALLLQSRRQGWSHVDWELVGKGLK